MKSISDCLTPSTLIYFLDRYLGWDINVKSTINIDVTEKKRIVLIKDTYNFQRFGDYGKYNYDIEPLSGNTNSVPLNSPTSYRISGNEIIWWATFYPVPPYKRTDVTRFYCPVAHIHLDDYYFDFIVDVTSLPGRPGSGTMSWTSSLIKGKIVDTGDPETSYIDLNAEGTIYYRLDFNMSYMGYPPSYGQP